MSSPARSADARQDGPAARPGAGAARWLRGAVVGFAASVVALTGHVLGAGSTPSLLPLAGLTSVAVLLAVALSGVRWRLTSLLAMLLGAQAVFHLTFASAGHAPATTLAHPAHLGSASGDGDGRMLALHVAAALVTAWLLRRGEDVCWELASAVVRPVRAARALAVGTVARRVPRVAAARRRARPLLSRLLVDAAPRRGPPVPAAG
jgi:hypothetical protein